MADIDESAYQAVGTVRGERERQRLLREFDTQRAAEAADKQRRQETARKAQAEERARQAARPYDERLTEQTCTGCHTADNYAGKRHTWLYWRLVVARMVWINDAPVPSPDRATIGNYLARAFPATDEERLMEYGLPLMAVGMLAAAGWACRRLRMRRPAGEVDQV